MTNNTFFRKAAIAALIFFNLFTFSQLVVAQSTFGGGSGTDYDPYLICNRTNWTNWPPT